MFDNIGGKIKGLAKFCAYGCVICGVIIALIGLVNYIGKSDYLEYASVYGGAGYGYSSLTEAGDVAYNGLQMLKYGLITAAVGFVSAWPLYGFGELIEDASMIAYNTKNREAFTVIKTANKESKD